MQKNLAYRFSRRSTSNSRLSQFTESPASEQVNQLLDVRNNLRKPANFLFVCSEWMNTKHTLEISPIVLERNAGLHKVRIKPTQAATKCFSFFLCRSHWWCQKSHRVLRFIPPKMRASKRRSSSWYVVTKRFLPSHCLFSSVECFEKTRLFQLNFFDLFSRLVIFFIFEIFFAFYSFLCRILLWTIR